MTLITIAYKVTYCTIDECSLTGGSKCMPYIPSIVPRLSANTQNDVARKALVRGYYIPRLRRLDKISAVLVLHECVSGGTLHSV